MNNEASSCDPVKTNRSAELQRLASLEIFALASIGINYLHVISNASAPHVTVISVKPEVHASHNLSEVKRFKNVTSIF